MNSASWTKYKSCGKSWKNKVHNNHQLNKFSREKKAKGQEECTNPRESQRPIRADCDAKLQAKYSAVRRKPRRMSDAGSGNGKRRSSGSPTVSHKMAQMPSIRNI